MFLPKFFRNDSKKESDKVPASSSAHEPFPVKRQKTIPKRRKWNEDYNKYGFFVQKVKRKIVIHQPSVCSA